MKSIFFIVCVILIPFCATAQIINTIAGNGSTTNTGDGDSALTAGIDLPGEGVFDKYGNYYFCTDVGNSVRKISVDGIISLVVGTGVGGFSGDGGQATAAKLKTTQAVILDTFGNLYVTDEENNRVRKVDITTGIISTIAGNGTPGYSSDGIPATDASLNDPNGLCFDKKGNLYIADYGNSRIRKITPSGIISTFAGTGVNGYNGDGGLADTSEIKGVLELCSDDTGNIYLADEANGRIRKVDTFGIIHTIAGTGVAGFSGDGTTAISAEVEPHFITFDKFGNIYFDDVYANRIRKIDNAGIVSTITGSATLGFTGDGGPATAAEINTPFGLTTDTCGNLIFCDGHNYRIRKITFDTSCHPYSDPFDSASLTIKTITTAGINIYPNPAYTSITITASPSGSKGEGKIESITICNLLGQTVLYKTSNSGQEEVNVAALPQGIYIIKVTGSEGKETVSKFLKQ